MVSRHTGRHRFAARVALGLFAASAFAPAAEDDPRAKRRMAVMQAAVESLEPTSSEVKGKAALAVAAKPLLRYSDPTRGGVKEESSNNVLLDAGVWRLGAEGRPAALVTLEIYRAPDGGHVLSYEFLSLTEAKFTLAHKTEEVRWEATGSALSLKELPDAPKPATTAAARLAQMRQQARRFGAKETFNKETIECRLLAQPLDRYQSDAEKIADGAIFALANGTNPEVGIVLEADAERWRYGVARLGAAETTVTLDGKAVVAFEKFNARGRRDGPYNSGSHKIDLGK
jgi:hypothetical protein